MALPSRITVMNLLFAKPAAVTAAGGGQRKEESIHMKHIIAVLLENEPGALSRVVGFFRPVATTSNR
jgi:hypothetical protein